MIAAIQQTIRFTVLAMIFAALCSCASNFSSFEPTLVLPDAFKGDIFLLEDRIRGENWQGQEIDVPSSGIVLIKDISVLCVITPNRYRARYRNGTKLGNSVF